MKKLKQTMQATITKQKAHTQQSLLITRLTHNKYLSKARTTTSLAPKQTLAKEVNLACA
jgi:hypothetical protein